MRARSPALASGGDGGCPISLCIHSAFTLHSERGFRGNGERHERQHGHRLGLAAEIPIILCTQLPTLGSGAVYLYMIDRMGRRRERCGA